MPLFTQKFDVAREPGHTIAVQRSRRCGRLDRAAEHALGAGRAAIAAGKPAAIILQPEDSAIGRGEAVNGPVWHTEAVIRLIREQDRLGETRAMARQMPGIGGALAKVSHAGEAQKARCAGAPHQPILGQSPPIARLLRRRTGFARAALDGLAARLIRQGRGPKRATGPVRVHFDEGGVKAVLRHVYCWLHRGGETIVPV